MLFPKSKIHFIGIGGVGMRGLAEWSLKEGHIVSGSDCAPNETTKRLEALGALVCPDRPSPALTRSEIVVRSSAIGADHAEVIEARKLGKKILLRGEFLGELARSRQTIAVCGSHGKSTTTALIGHCLRDLWPSHTYVGARVNSLGSSYHYGDSRRLVAEVDESDGTFLHFPCDLAVLTGVSLDHVTHYGSAERLWESFGQFLENTSPLQRIIVFGDEDLALGIARKTNRPLLSYGLSQACDVRATNIQANAEGSSFDLHLPSECKQEPLRIKLPLLGKHNVINALAAVAVGLELRLNPREIAARLETFEGVERRLEKLASKDGVDVYSDYAHNPQKIAAALEAVSAAYGQDSVYLVVEPHRYTRLHSLWGEFLTALDQSPQLVLLPVYSAGEISLPGVSSDHLKEALVNQLTATNSARSHHRIESLDPNEENFSAILDRARRHAKQSPCAIVFVGAGKSHDFAHSLALLLENTGDQERSKADKKQSARQRSKPD